MRALSYRSLSESQLYPVWFSCLNSANSPRAYWVKCGLLDLQRSARVQLRGLASPGPAARALGRTARTFAMGSREIGHSLCVFLVLVHPHADVAKSHRPVIRLQQQRSRGNLLVTPGVAG